MKTKGVFSTSFACVRFILFTLFRSPAAATRADPGGAGS